MTTVRKYEMFGRRVRGCQRIRRLSDGVIGGWIQSEKNLSHEGTCFVYDEARVTDDAFVTGNAHVRDRACVSGLALIEKKRTRGRQCYHQR